MYKALYRKYRPDTFNDVIGQEPITTTLKNQIVNDKLSHSYIFTGTRGTGKTSCAKILAKAVNCKGNKNGEPCLVCDICKGIDNGSVIDVVEMDAASNNKVDDIRFLKDELNYTPSKAKFRVYIIDEVHMLSISAFNALLKVMEEPPSYVMFILATTEIHKVPTTILSRCQRYDFKRIIVSDIVNSLLCISEKEGINTTESGLKAIAILSDGGMRDALSILDLVSTNGEEITEEYVKNMCGVSSKDDTFKLVTYILEKNVKGAIEILNNMYMNGSQPKYILDELLLVFRNLLVSNISNDYMEILSCLDYEKPFYEQMKDKTNYKELSFIINLISDFLDKINFSFNNKIDIEVFVIKLCVYSFNSNTAIDSSMYTVSEKNVVKRKSLKEEHSSFKNTLNNELVGSKKTVDKDIKTTKIKEWDVIVNNLNKINPAIAPFLKGSCGYRRGEFVLIESSNSMLYNMMKNSAKTQNDMKDIINDILGFVPRLGQYKIKKEEIEKEERKIDKFIKDARNSGIEYEEE